MKRLLLLLQAGALLMADPLTLVISNETAPAGGMAQIKVWSVWPANIASGRIVMDFDPAVFGDIDTVAVFSATGDACAAAIVQNQHLDVQFTSASGGIGRLPDLPILGVSVPVLPNAVAGTQVTISVNATGWSGRNAYEVTASPAVFTVGGTLSISRVEPGGGIQPEGTVLKISGMGFSPDTTAEMNGVSLSSIQFVSSQEVDVTLGAPAEVTGKHVRLRNADGAEVLFFPSVRHSLQLPPPSYVKAPIQPTFPLRKYMAATSFTRYIGPSGSGFVVLENPNSASADVALLEGGLQPDGRVGATVDSFTIPPEVSRRDPASRRQPGRWC